MVRGVQMTDEVIIEYGGHEYTYPEIEKLIAWTHEVRYADLQDILEKRGLTISGKLRHYDPEEDLGDGVSLVTEGFVNSRHEMIGLKLPMMLLHEEKDEAEFRRLIAEKIGKLGDRIMSAYRDHRR
jgi:hypothetical protein